MRPVPKFTTMTSLTTLNACEKVHCLLLWKCVQICLQSGTKMKGSMKHTRIVGLLSEAVASICEVADHSRKDASDPSHTVLPHSHNHLHTNC